MRTQADLDLAPDRNIRLVACCTRRPNEHGVRAKANTGTALRCRSAFQQRMIDYVCIVNYPKMLIAFGSICNK